MEDLDMNKGDEEMVQYWFNKYANAKSKKERLEVRKAAQSFLFGDSLMFFLDACISWHSSMMDKSIYKPG